MDLSKYVTDSNIESYKECLKQRMGCKHEINVFLPVKNRYSFDISRYKGPLPVAVVSNTSGRSYVYGYTDDTAVNTIHQLEPHKSKKAEMYLWSNECPSFDERYGEIMWMLNHRCVQLSNPPAGLGYSVSLFEKSRHILWLCVLETKCVSMDRLIDLEKSLMKSITKDNHQILKKCHQLYKLKDSTPETVAEWIEKIYKTNTQFEDTGGLFEKVGTQVKEMLT
tara:strand:- start:1050 stop:1718 length:669 start_codon:yes stop_codon:yes gene_type:complete